LVFSRAEARDAYPAGARPAARAGDANETQIQYDLYRMAFDGGKGGRPEPVAGASRNGMSNSFPKISPDGRWIVYVQARNGQLMRPDSQLYIVPAAGGTARRMACNTPRMNSWHSFSPNGRWMVFSSKSRSPYTQMFLTHIDADGADSPAILIENATAANRAVNIPEFVNIGPHGLIGMEAPVAEYYRVVDEATALVKAGRHEAAALEWKKAVELNPGETTAHFHLGTALARQGRLSEATAEFEKSLELDAAFPSARANLGGVLIQRGMAAQAIAHLEQAILSDPKQADAHNNLGIALAMTGRLAEAIPHVEQAVELAEAKDPTMLDLLAGMYAEAGRYPEAIKVTRQALDRAAQQKNTRLVETLKAKLSAYSQVGARRVK
jgi:Flp pilus assembly protein TadD